MQMRLSQMGLCVVGRVRRRYPALRIPQAGDSQRLWEYDIFVWLTSAVKFRTLDNASPPYAPYGARDNVLSIPLAASSDVIRRSRVLLSHTLDTARSY